MTTPVELINIALKHTGVLGVGQTALAEDIQDAFKVMNMMLGQWQAKRIMMYHLVNVTIPCTGALSYTIGIGGVANVPRPDRIPSAFVRQLIQTPPNQVDYTLRIITAREDYDRIAAKQQGSVPNFLFYDAGYPLGTLYPWPLPSNTYELHLSVMDTFQTFATVADVINLPPQYEEAICYNLSGRLRPLYGLQPDPTINAIAKSSLNILQAANTQIPTSQVDQFLTTNQRYNIYTDQVN